MAYSSIVKPSVYFNTKLISGNGGTQSLTGVGFKPDFTWIKSRSRVDPHSLTDIVRGVASQLDSSLTSAPTTHSDAITSFNSDGFSLGSQADVNRSGTTFASWNWLAGGSQGSSNTAGSINTTYTSVNTTAGFSISTYTGTGSAATIGHGLGVVPQVVLIKCTQRSENWTMYHKGLNASGAGTYIYLNTNAAAGGSGSNTSMFNNTAPTSSVFSVGADGATNDTQTYIAYSFAEKKGYSKFGSYTGNGNADGPFIYTGFKPAWVMIKRTDSTNNWIILDNKRDTDNPNNVELQANSTNAEDTSNIRLDMLSNGWKTRASTAANNASSGTYIYMAFAEQPLVANSGTDGVPATAR